ncbi:OmpA family protein [Acidocella sp.]|uniref:OmpA family protein n=1 Tax=Acidocella sp. TaxID=50710 RepID=UPI002629795C|nr:OmpA family protein [Acidocella sp.]
MTRWRFNSVCLIGLAGLLCGCSAGVDTYHQIEGGAIAQNRQPPPGYNLPYPNLADIPPPLPAAKPGAQAAIAAQAQTGISAPASGALAGLTLPASAPPPPDVPGLALPAAELPPPTAATPPAPAPKPPDPPVGLGFRPGSAVLAPSDMAPLRAFAQRYKHQTVRVAGFGEGNLALALERAQRLADALTAFGVPASAIRITAIASGSGGFVQFVY